MPLPLDRTLKREIVLDGRPHTVTIGPDGVRLVAKGFRKGRGLSWAAVWALGEEADAATGAGAAIGAPRETPRRRGRGTSQAQEPPPPRTARRTGP